MPKKIITFAFLLLFTFHSVIAQNEVPINKKSINSLASRVLPKKQAALFTFHIKSSTINYFEISASKRRITIRGNSPVSVAAGLNYYLRNELYISVGQNDNKSILPDFSPIPLSKVRKESPYRMVTFFTDDNFDQITAQWDWDRWEREIDLMALRGVTHPISQAMLTKLSDPLSQKIVQRMGELGMKYADENQVGITTHRIHLLPESVGTNPILFDLRSDMVWQRGVPNMKEWIERYPMYRYGHSTASLQAAWEGFHQTVYPSNQPIVSPSKSVFLHSPSLYFSLLSNWLKDTTSFDHNAFAKSCETFFIDSDIFLYNSNYTNDAINIVRQYLTNQIRQSFARFSIAWNQHDLQILERETKLLHQLQRDVLEIGTNEGNQIEATKALFQKYRRRELEPKVSIVELPLSFHDGYGPFEPHYYTLQPYSQNQVGQKPRIFATGIPITWKNVQRGDIETNGYQLSTQPMHTKIAYALGKDQVGKLKMVIDTNNNHDFSDDKIFEPLPFIDDNHSPINQFISLAFERLYNNIIVWDKIPFFMGTIPGQEVIVWNFARYATTRLGETNIAISSDKFNDFSFTHIELKIDNNHDYITNDEYILYNDTLYRNKGVDLNKNILVLEKTISSKSQLFSPQAGFKAIPYQGQNHITKETVSLEKSKGKYVVLYFWGTWNNDCVDDLPYLISMYGRCDRSKVEMLGILDNSPDISLERIIQRFSIDWPQITSDAASRIIQDYKISSFPTILLIDPNGIIINKDMSLDSLEMVLTKLRLFDSVAGQ
ncbi:MAG: alpha-N-acetylglucosaminidase C-terminal domain-containing protein [Prevotellaceae bacterium]|jgi:peroxiredoxin|nr:alpha-N-acetylglucosaminidase C-terminal domain-containing protein [Prevotellaceae bacterium]